MNAAARAIFFDRDGVLNQAVVRNGKPYPPANSGDVVICEDAPAALREAADAGFLLIGVTNQPDIARGQTTRVIVQDINARIMAAMPLLDIVVCPHDDQDGCGCRKPKPGMLLEAAARYQVDLVSSFMVGDRWRDVEAGRRAGCTTVWIDAGYSEAWPVAAPDQTVQSTAQAVAWILAQSRRNTGEVSV